jgi:hypothetical protein
MDSTLPQAFDADGKKIVLSGSDRMARINRNAKVIAASDSLSMAVVRLLQEQDVDVEQQPLMLDPASVTDQAQVLGLRIARGDRQVVAPIVPGAEVVRLYATTADGEVIADNVVASLSPALEPHRLQESQIAPVGLRRCHRGRSADRGRVGVDRA